MSLQITKWWGSPGGWSLGSEITSRRSAQTQRPQIVMIAGDFCEEKHFPGDTSPERQRSILHPVQLREAECLCVWDVGVCFYIPSVSQRDDNNSILPLVR